MELHMKNKIKSLVLAGMVLATPAIAISSNPERYTCVPVRIIGKDPVVLTKLSIYWKEGQIVKFDVVHKTRSGKEVLRNQQYDEVFSQDCSGAHYNCENGMLWYGPLKGNSKIKMEGRISFRNKAWHYDEVTTKDGKIPGTDTVLAGYSDFICH